MAKPGEGKKAREFEESMGSGKQDGPTGYRAIE
jgi:hypothetical protein